MSRPRILLADAHLLFMQGIRALLHSRADVVGMYENGQELLDAAPQVRPDIIILDITLPVVNGLEAARRLKRSVPEARVIFLTQHAQDSYVKEAQHLGVSGYLLKRCAFSELSTAIDSAEQGAPYFSPLLSRAAKSDVFSGGEEELREKLTNREREVLRLTSEGRSAKEIANELKISVKTVQFHKANLTQKLGIRTTAELVKYAVRRGFTEA